MELWTPYASRSGRTWGGTRVYHLQLAAMWGWKNAGGFHVPSRRCWRLGGTSTPPWTTSSRPITPRIYRSDAQQTSGFHGVTRRLRGRSTPTFGRTRWGKKSTVCRMRGRSSLYRNQLTTLSTQCGSLTGRLMSTVGPPKLRQDWLCGGVSRELILSLESCLRPPLLFRVYVY